MHSATTAAALSLHLPVRQEWLDRSREEVIEPDLPIVDPHHHLVDRPETARYLLPELLAEDPWGYPLVRDGSREPTIPDGLAKHAARAVAQQMTATRPAPYSSGTAPRCGKNSLHAAAATNAQIGEATIDPLSVLAARST